MEDVFIVSSARTAIGSFGGALAGSSPIELGTATAKEALRRANLTPDLVEASVYGQVIPTEPRDAYLARVVAIEAGAPDTSHAFNVNRLCGSGAQAIVSATQVIREGDAAISLAGGAEVMSQAPYSLPHLRFGKRMGPATATDWLEALHDPFGNGHMGVTAENIAQQMGITRQQQDAFAVETQRRAKEAISSGRFAEQIVGVEVKQGRSSMIFDTDEHPRDVTAEKLAGMRPVFKEGGTVTAANASGINDGAASLVLASERAVQQHNLAPQARIVSWAVAGCAPEVMGLGPIRAVPTALERAGLKLSEIDLIESNEAFAVQALAVQRELGFDPEITNVDGGAVALGHPVGATGAILTVKIIHRLRERGLRYGLVTMCIGGGQGIALIVEAV